MTRAAETTCKASGASPVQSPPSPEERAETRASDHAERVIQAEGACAMTDEQKDHVTRILRDFASDPEAANELLPLVYEQLRAIAQKRMGNERDDHTLQATALVHEAYMKLVGDVDMKWQSRGHFYGAAAEAMRRILIDHARAKKSAKRGGDRRKLPASVLDLATDCDAEDIIALDDAITKLEEEDPRAASVVRLRFFAGLEVKEAAEALGVSERTAMREWSFARARLHQLLKDGESDEAKG